jgi:hypothetical protein
MIVRQRNTEAHAAQRTSEDENKRDAGHWHPRSREIFWR